MWFWLPTLSVWLTVGIWMLLKLHVWNQSADSWIPFVVSAFLSQDLQNPAICTLGLLCYTSTLDIRDIMFTVSLHICQMCKCPFFIAFCKHVFLRSNILKIIQDKVTTVDVFIIRKMWVVFAFVILPATMPKVHVLKARVSNHAPERPLFISKPN